MVHDTSSVTKMDNLEEVLDALNDFEKKLPKEIPPLLNEYLCRVAKTGETLFPWARLKSFFRAKLDDVMIRYNEDLPSDHLVNSPNVENAKFDEMRARILVALERFHGAPFTIQRLCELITEPKRHYKRTDKFLRGIEKNVLVVSTVDPFGRKIVSESPKNLVNGLDSNGEELIKTEEATVVNTPVVSWPTDDIATTWPTQSTDNGHIESVVTHNGEGDNGTNDTVSDDVPTQSTDTSSFVKSHPEGHTSQSSDSSSGEITPTTSLGNSKLEEHNSSNPNIDLDQSENSGAADHVTSESTDASCVQSPSSPEKCVEITASDIDVVVEASNDLSNNNICQETIELTTVTLPADSANEVEESVTTTANENIPSKQETEPAQEPKEINDGAVTSSESRTIESKSVVDSGLSEESKTDDSAVSQSNSAILSDNSTKNSSSSVGDNVTSSDSSAKTDILINAEPELDSNVVSSEQTVITETENILETDSSSDMEAAHSHESEQSEQSEQVSRSEEPMEQD
ncbi:hypothetical protein SNE40_013742 [Patella caerulea]|uniref:Serine/threonine-protein phosphatase 4 regulatory subunit 2 n=2 Tax=Patella caerulea TaxID=87958 RepID=A0AAN8JGM4_PATCE